MSNTDRNELIEARDFSRQRVALLSEVLEIRLGKRYKSSVHMEHGQVKSAARYVMKTIGYDWVLSVDDDDKYIRMHTRMALKRLVKSIAGKWHGDPSSVWRQFRGYCIEYEAQKMTDAVVKKMSLKSE